MNTIFLDKGDELGRMKTKERVFIPLEVGEKFRKLRSKKNISQMELGNEIDVSHTIISKIERGAYSVNKTKLERLCNFLEIDFRSITNYSAQKYSEDLIDPVLQLKNIEHSLETNPEEAIEELRRLKENLKQTKGLKNSLSVLICYLRGRCKEKLRKWQEAMTDFETASKLADQFPELKTTNIKAMSNYCLGCVCHHTNQPELALSYIEKGFEAFDPDGQRPHVYYHLWITKAGIFEKLNRNSEALCMIEDMWSEMGKIDVSDARLNMYQIRVELLIKLDRLDEAIVFAHEGLEKARLEGMYDRCYELWSSLGEAYTKKELLSNAEVCFRSALKLEKNIRKQYLIISAYTKLGLLYLSKEDLTSAQNFLKQAVNLGRKIKDNYRLVKALLALGQCHLKQQKDIKALKFWEESLTLAKKHAYDILAFDILLEITDICKRKNLPLYKDYVDQLQQTALKIKKGGAIFMQHPSFIKKTMDHDPPNV